MQSLTFAHADHNDTKLPKLSTFDYQQSFLHASNSKGVTGSTPITILDVAEMSYNLRPERKLKRPARYKSEDDDSTEASARSKQQHTATHMTTSGISSHQAFAATAHQTPHQSPLTSLPEPVTSPAYKAAAIPHVASNTGTLSKMRDFHNMQKGNLNSRDLPPPPAGRSGGRARSQNSKQGPPNVFPSAKPAAFPSVQTTEPPPEKTTEHDGKYGIRELMKAREASDDEGIQKVKRHMDDMYSAKGFPASINENSKKWYLDVNKRWGPGRGIEQVICPSSKLIIISLTHVAKFESIPFTSLWPSLRQSIIDQICDTFLPGTYHDFYHPAKYLLGLPQSDFEKIMSENRKGWYDENDIPKYLRDLKRLYPNQAVDPDSPPACEIVKAIIFLKQNHFPGELLGEWQDALPSVEVFRAPIPFCEGACT